MRFSPGKIIAASAALVLLAACATPTAYAPAQSPHGYGYSEQQIEQNRYRVTFRGNSLTDREMVEAALLYRAAELTIAQGGDYFVVADRDTQSRSRLQPIGGRGYPGFYPRWTYFHPRYGWRSWYDPFWDDTTYREITQYEATAEVAIFHGEKPSDNANAFDARDVERNLAPRMRASQEAAEQY